MATKTERLVIEIAANAAGAITQIDRFGKTVETRVGQADKTAGRFSESLDKVGGRLVDIGTKATAAGGVAAAGLFVAAQAAQNLADSVDKAQAVFGEAGANSLNVFAEGAATNLGKSRAAALDAASAYGLLLKQSGLGGRELAAQSAQLATVTADLAERFKKPYEEVQKSIESVLKTGSGKSLRGLLGVDIQIDPESLKGLGAAERTAKVLDEIFRQTADSAGFFAKSTDDLGAQIEVAQAKWENAKAAFGQASLPALTTLAESVTGLLDLFNKLPSGVQNAIGSFATFGTAIALVGGPLSSLAGLGAQAFAPLVAQGTKLGGVLGALKGSGAAAAIGGPLTVAAIGAAGVFEAWASETAQVDKQVEALTSSVLGLTDAGQTLPTLAQSLRSILEVNAGGTDVFAKTGLSVTQVTAAVNAAPGSFDKFRDSVDGLFGVFDNLGGITSFGDDVAGLREEAGRAGPEVAGVVNQLLALYEADGITADEFRKTIDYLVDLDKGAANSSKSLGEQAKALRDAAGAAAISGQALSDFNIAVDDNAKLEDKVAALNRLTAAFPEAAAAAGLIPPPLGDTATAADAAARAINSYADVVANAADRVAAKKQDLTLPSIEAEIQENPRKAIALGQAEIRLQQAQKRLADLSSSKKREEEAAAALDKVRDAQDGLTDALRRRRDAQEKLDALTRRSAVAGSVPLLQEITRAAEAGVADAEKKVAEVQATFGVGSSQDVAAQRALEAARGRRSQSVDLLGRGLAEQGGRNQREIRDAQEDLADANRGVSKAVRDKREAELEYSKALKTGSEDALERKQAELEVASAWLDYRTAAADVTQALIDGKDPFAELEKILGEAADTGLLTKDTVAQLTTAFGNLETAAAKNLGWLSELIDALNGGGTQPASAAPAPPPGTTGTTPTGPSSGRTPTAPAIGMPLPNVAPGLFPGGAPMPDPLAAIRGLPVKDYTAGEKLVNLEAVVMKWVRSGKWGEIINVITRRGAKFPGFATGGIVPGSGLGDTVPAMLTPGEFVLTRTAVSQYGTDALKAMNKGTAQVQKFATGGLVRGPASVPASSFRSTQTPARTSTAATTRSVEVSPTFNITSTEPKQTAAEVVRKLRRATFLGGVR